MEQPAETKTPDDPELTQEQIRQIMRFAHDARHTSATLDSRVADELRQLTYPMAHFMGAEVEKHIRLAALSPKERAFIEHLSRIVLRIQWKLVRAVRPDLYDDMKDFIRKNEPPPVAADDIDEDYYSGSEDGEEFEKDMKKNKAAVLRYLAKKAPRLTVLHCLRKYEADMEGTHFERSEVNEWERTPDGAIYFATYSTAHERKRDWLEGLLATGRPFCVVCPQWVLGTYKPSRGLKVLILKQYFKRNRRRWSTHVPECCWMLGNFNEPGFNTNDSITIEYLNS